MGGVTLPYQLQDGQKAYASRLMANLQAIADKLNRVSLPGLPDADMEQALQQLKLLLDAEAAAGARTLESFAYDSAANQLQITLKNGARYTVSMAPFFNDYLGASSATADVTIDGERRIRAAIRENAISYEMLTGALQALLDSKVAAGEAGNAAAIRFQDGMSMQEKLDAGALNGKDGADGIHATLAGMYYFRIGDDGHLYAGMADGAAAPPLSIDENGHLIYTID